MVVLIKADFRAGTTTSPNGPSIHVYLGALNVPVFGFFVQDFISTVQKRIFYLFYTEEEIFLVFLAVENNLDIFQPASSAFLTILSFYNDILLQELSY